MIDEFDARAGTARKGVHVHGYESVAPELRDARVPALLAGSGLRDGAVITIKAVWGRQFDGALLEPEAGRAVDAVGRHVEHAVLGLARGAAEAGRDGGHGEGEGEDELHDGWIWACAARFLAA